MVAAQANVTALQAKMDAKFGNVEHAIEVAISKVQVIQGILSIVCIGQKRS